MKNNKKKIILILIPIIIILAVVISLLSVNKKNDKNGVFSLNEKRWIESNKSNVVDISILNDIPIFGEDGDGVFFDFLNDFSKETEIKFNMIPYKSSENAESKYKFEMTNSSNLNKNQLSFYDDNYVLVSKDNTEIKDISDLKNVTIGMLESDINKVKSILEDNGEIIYNSYNNISSIVTALNKNDILYAIIPKTIYINEIFENNYYIVHNIPEITNNYVLDIDGDDPTLNSIIKKYYVRWSKYSLDKSYNKRLLNLYFDKKKIDDETIANFQGKEYTYGYVKNIPYESKINDEFIGYNSEILDGFAKSMDITFNIKEYSSVDDLEKDLNNGNIDLAFNYYKFNNLNDNFDYTYSPYNEKIVVLTHLNNITTSISSLKSLNNKKVLMVDNKLSNYISKNYKANVKTFNKPSSLFNFMNEDSIIVMDYNLYDNYRNTKLNNYKVIYEDKLKDFNFNFIILDSNKNKAFDGLFKFYISNIEPDLYMSRAKVKLQKDSSKVDYTFIYILVVLVVLLIVSLIALKHKYNKKKNLKNDRVRYVDSLTSLKNRHYLNNNYEKWQENKIYPQSIIIIDINKIGRINDVYGHQEGDKVIKKAANILINNQLEQSDIVRTNGDEFLIYMVGYEESKVIAYMKRLNREFKNLPYNFGATLGYSMIVDDVKTIDDAINEAVLEVKTNKEKLDSNK